MTHDHAHGREHDHAGHSHGFGHSHTPEHFGRIFAIGVLLNGLYVVIEGAFGYFAGSLALIADAGHNLSDVLGLLLAWGAAWLATKPPSRRRTYGYRRAPILASLGNAAILLVAVGAIGVEAVQRLLQPEPVATDVMLWVAVAGVFVNGITAWLLMGGSKHDLNMRGAFLHMAADTAVTLGVIVAVFLIRWTGWLWIDPAISLLIAVVILIGTWGLLRQSVRFAIDEIPPGISEQDVETYFRGLPGVEEMHDLHIWPLSTTEIALTVHLVIGGAADGDALQRRIPGELARRFNIIHSTVQIETPATADACPLRSAEVL